MATKQSRRTFQHPNRPTDKSYNILYTNNEFSVRNSEMGQSYSYFEPKLPNFVPLPWQQNKADEHFNIQIFQWISLTIDVQYLQSFS